MKLKSIGKEVFTETDLACVHDFQLDEMVYMYECEGWEGSGYALVRKGNLYDLLNLNHCSCYGPLEQKVNTHYIPP
jgi:hypothetical protein